MPEVIYHLRCKECGAAFTFHNSRGKYCSPRCQLYAHLDRAGGCWEWKGNTNRHGYGQLQNRGLAKNGVRAHVLSWVLHVGPVPSGMFVCHKCDNRRCSRPDHLFLGTCADNMADMVRKGRSRFGIKNHNAKFTEADVLEIVQALLNGERVTDIAIRFGCGTSRISTIKAGKSWKHLTAHHGHHSSLAILAQGIGSREAIETRRGSTRSEAEGKSPAAKPMRQSVSSKTLP